MMLLLPIALAACAGSDDGSNISHTSDRNGTNQPLPTNCRPQLTGVHENRPQRSRWRACRFAQRPRKEKTSKLKR
jgi:hypothetical protein